MPASGTSRIFRTLQQAIMELPATGDPAGFAAAALERFGVSYFLPHEQLQQLPPSGPVIVVANHPFGGIDGLIAIASLAQRRRDLKILAHGLLATVPSLSDIILPIDPFGGRSAARSNAPSVLRALRHLEAGGLLLMFPAGEVSHFSPRRASISDPVWNPGAARIVTLSGAPVLPMHFQGRNSLLFQAGGLLHPRIRTLMLPREILNKNGRRVDVRIGRLLPAERLAKFDTPHALLNHLRATTYLLGDERTAVRTAPRALEPICPPIAGELLSAEVAALPASSHLGSCGGFSVHLARSGAIPHVLQEIGRRREESFRAVGEGTGRTSDLDLHDDYYEHIFVWNSTDQSIAGGYRIGRIDEILRRFGNRGLYLNSLFEFREPFFRLLGPALELGRSFVGVNYQRSYAPLLLLWRGVLEYVARNPRYARLIGPVSLSNDYDLASRALVVKGLQAHRHDAVLAALVRARNPFAPHLSSGSLFGQARRLPDMETLDELIVDREPDGKGLPVLIRQYLKLGARTLAFNVDAAFGHAIDCLITVDVRQIPSATLRRYMGPDSLDAFQRHWANENATRRRRTTRTA